MQDHVYQAGEEDAPSRNPTTSNQLACRGDSFPQLPVQIHGLCEGERGVGLKQILGEKGRNPIQAGCFLQPPTLPPICATSAMRPSMPCHAMSLLPCPPAAGISMSPVADARFRKFAECCCCAPPEGSCVPVFSAGLRVILRRRRKYELDHSWFPRSSRIRGSSAAVLAAAVACHVWLAFMRSRYQLNGREARRAFESVWGMAVEIEGEVISW